ncbi:MAG: fasciclin domain-containing protein [Chitinophagaceae bacterium]|nr:fasciclin domain-containing protein [Chitinophagaceae bacterium]
MRKNLFSTAVTFSFIMLGLVLILESCKKEEYKLATTDDVNITGYLLENPDSFSLFKEILDRTETSSFLNAYGTYTCFAVTNSGVQKFLSDIGAANVGSADINVLKDMVRFHLIEDTLATGDFTDGKLPLPTMLGQFLITGVSNNAGVSRYLINRQALTYQTNVRVGNGIMHIIDNVLRPATKTLAVELESKTDFSIFVQAMKETGWYARMNVVDPDPAKRWYTILAESNKALSDSGITTYAQLKARYSQTGNPADPKDSLNMYVSYHILPGLKYLADIITVSAHQTMLPQEVVSSKLQAQEVYINDDVFDGILEPGVILIRPNSDNSTTNGVWHTSSGHFVVKFRKPQAVFWDVSAFDEILKLPAFYKRQNYGFVKANQADKPIKSMDWHYNSASTTMTYTYSSTGSVTIDACNQDVCLLPLGLPARAAWWELQTPVVVKGRYKVWGCYRTQRQSASSVNVNNVFINGILMQRQLTFTEFIPSGTDAEREAIGWKQYTALVNNNFAGRLLGTVEIATTGRQIFRIENVTGTQNNNNLDMIHFIPADDPQIFPRFARDGSKVYQ